MNDDYIYRKENALILGGFVSISQTTTDYVVLCEYHGVSKYVYIPHLGPALLFMNRPYLFCDSCAKVHASPSSAIGVLPPARNHEEMKP